MPSKKELTDEEIKDVLDDFTKHFISKKYSDKKIFDLYKQNKITDFKTILKWVKD